MAGPRSGPVEGVRGNREVPPAGPGRPRALFAAVETALASAGEPDDVLREVVRLLVGQPEVAWAGIAFLENGELVLGPSAGTPDPVRRAQVTLSYKEQPVGELLVDGTPDPADLQAVGDRLGEHVLLGWDTGGEAWEP